MFYRVFRKLKLGSVTGPPINNPSSDIFIFLYNLYLQHYIEDIIESTLLLHTNGCCTTKRPNREKRDIYNQSPSHLPPPYPSYLPMGLLLPYMGEKYYIRVIYTPSPNVSHHWLHPSYFQPWRHHHICSLLHDRNWCRARSNCNQLSCAIYVEKREERGNNIIIKGLLYLASNHFYYIVHSIQIPYLILVC